MDWIGLGWVWDGMGWDLCVGLLYEHRFAVLIMVKRNSLSKCLTIIIFSGYLSIVSSQPKGEGKGERRKIECQQRSTSGRSYEGEANTTADGIPCQRWSETQPYLIFVLFGTPPYFFNSKKYAKKSA